MTVPEALKILIAKIEQQALEQPEVEASDILRQWLEQDCKLPRKLVRRKSKPRRGIGMHGNADMFRGK